LARKAFIIAEAGVNHNGSVKAAHALIDAAADAGADCVKFQTFQAKKLVGKSAAVADYQNRAGEHSQLEMLQRLELKEDDHFLLAEHCLTRNIEFLSTAFDLDSLDFLVRQLGIRRVKIPSGEITHGAYLLRAARTGLPLLLSTGMSTLEEIESALKVIAFGLTSPIAETPSPAELDRAYVSCRATKDLADRVLLLQCTTEYPTPFDEANLSAMQAMGEHFGLRYGFSDHTEGISADIAAVALGAEVIEKHFTLDRAQKGPDHGASLEPVALKAMVKAIRETEQALGSMEKKPTATEMKNRDVARRSLVAAATIRAGEIFTDENLTAKRPGGGLSPMRIWELLGRRANRDYAPDEMIEL
jgi:N-acetylneuraminate synthase